MVISSTLQIIPELEDLTQDEIRNHRQQGRRCPICQVALASPIELLNHVQHDHLNCGEPNVGVGFEEIFNSGVTRKIRRKTEAVVPGTRRAQRQRELENRLKIENARLNGVEMELNTNSPSEEGSPSGSIQSIPEDDVYVHEETPSLDSESESINIDSGETVTLNVVPKILTVCNESAFTVRTYGCSYVDHYASSVPDLGWGCGFRNVQMMLSSLLTQTIYREQFKRYLDVSEDPPFILMPSIKRLQELIQKAWSQGFDTAGSRQLGGVLLNTRKWIGATEVVSLLSLFHIRCQLVDFHIPTGQDSTHPELFKWILNYFENSAEREFTPPLYLQHQGHSRIVMGIEEQRHGVLNLLVLDPSVSESKMVEISSAEPGVLLEVRVSMSNLRAPQYQIVAVQGLMENEEEYQESKILKSVRIPP